MSLLSVGNIKKTYLHHKGLFPKKCTLTPISNTLYHIINTYANVHTSKLLRHTATTSIVLKILCATR